MLKLNYFSILKYFFTTPVSIHNTNAITNAYVKSNGVNIPTISTIRPIAPIKVTKVSFSCFFMPIPLRLKLSPLFIKICADRDLNSRVSNNTLETSRVTGLGSPYPNH